MEQIYFMILNYNTYEETVACVETIRAMDDVQYQRKILIVDNGSTDGSAERLKLLEGEDVAVLCLEGNKGYSYGNNAGYQYIQEIGNTAFLVVCNSDVEFRDKTFLERVLREYNESKFDLLGVDVYSEALKRSAIKGHQSPFYPWDRTKWFVRYQINYHELERRRLTKEKFGLWQCVKAVYYRGIRFASNTLKRTIYRNWSKHRHEDIVAHGACFVLSKLFIKQEKKLFTPETQFYYEEMLLYLKLKERGYKSVYNPDIRVWHVHGKATAKAANNELNRKLFVIDHTIRSGKVYLAALERRRYKKKQGDAANAR